MMEILLFPVNKIICTTFPQSPNREYSSYFLVKWSFLPWLHRDLGKTGSQLSCQPGFHASRQKGCKNSVGSLNLTRSLASYVFSFKSWVWEPWPESCLKNSAFKVGRECCLCFWWAWSYRERSSWLWLCINDLSPTSPLPEVPCPSDVPASSAVMDSSLLGSLLPIRFLAYMRML